MTDYVWHDDDYNKRIKITVDSSKVISDVANDPAPWYSSGYNYTNRTMRLIIPGNKINYNATTIRAKLTTLNGYFQTEEMWVGQLSSDPIDSVYSFDGNQVRVTFDGGNTTSPRMLTFSSIWTDPINVNVTANSPLMFSYYVTTDGGVARSYTSSDYGSYYKATVNDAATTSATGYTTGITVKLLIEEIIVISGSNYLSNFPLSVCLSSESGIYNEDITDIFTTLSGNSTNLAVYTTSGTQDVQCYTEIDYWDYINERAVLWVNIPELSSDTDTVLYLYYDSENPNTAYVGTTGSYPARQVWDNNYVGVWHMSQDPSGSAPQLLDSTYNMNDGTSYGGMGSDDLVASGVGGSWVFDGTDDAVYVNPNDSLNIVDSITLEWYGSFTTGVGTMSNNILIGKAYDGGTYTTASYCLNVYKQPSYDRIFFNLDGPGGYYATTPAPIYVDNIYSYIVGSYTNASWVLRYNNSELAGSRTYVGNINQNINTPFTFGMTYWGGSFVNPFLGVFSETRLSKVVRTMSWLSACYYTLSDNLVYYGTVEEKPAFIFYGYVTTNDIPSDNTVYLYRRSNGELVGTVVSDPVTGYFEINSAYSDDHFVIILPELEDTDLLSYDRINPGS